MGASDRDPRRAGDPADRRELERLNQGYIGAFLTSDAAWYDQNLAEEFVCIESDGSLLDKATFVERARAPADVASYRLEQVDVRLYGDIALIQATGFWTAPDGTPGLSRYIDVYHRGPDGWKAVSAQVTRARRPTA